MKVFCAVKSSDNFDSPHIASGESSRTQTLEQTLGYDILGDYLQGIGMQEFKFELIFSVVSVPRMSTKSSIMRI